MQQEDEAAAAVAKTLVVMFVLGLAVGAIAAAIQNLWLDDVSTTVVLVAAAAGVGPWARSNCRFERASHDGDPWQ